MINKTVHEIVREAETNYKSGTVQLSDHVNFSLKDTVEKVFAYLNSIHTTGSTDSLNREKPFFNIVVAARNIWYRATDIDRKDIVISPDKSSNVVTAFLATVKLQEWMKKARFNVFLNTWGRTLSEYGSAVCKFVEKDGELHASVVPFNRLILDNVQFDALPVIEKVYMTPAQLRMKEEYDQEAVDALIDNQVTRKTSQGNNKDNVDSFIEIYEVHGELPVANLIEPDKRKDEDWKTYRQQTHHISFYQDQEGKYKDFTLYKGKEAKNPYMITHLIEEDGRVIGIGAVEYLFDAQWMQNHTIKNMKDTLDLSSKLIFQTADANYVNRNVLTAIETGDILIHSANNPLTQINNTKPDVTALQNFASQWRVLAQELTSTPDALRGNTLPSGTPYALGSLLSQNANSLFEQMTENKGNQLEDMLRMYIIPFIKKQLDTKDEIVATLQDHDIKKIDSIYVPKEAVRRYNRHFFDTVIAGENPQPFDKGMMEGQVQSELSTQGNQRFFTPEDITWKEAFKDLEWEVDVNITNEAQDKQTLLTTLSTVLQSIASNPLILQDPNAKMVFSKILTATGVVSPLELSATQSPPIPNSGNSGQVDLSALNKANAV